MTAGYLPRLIDPRLRGRFGELPAILLVGPRAAGKTTTAGRLARTVIRLDRPAAAAAFEADPDAALRAQPEPVLLDEWQQVPGVLGAVRRAVEQDGRAGRFLLTGSVRTDLLKQVWPGTGRLMRMNLYGVTERELAGMSTADLFIDRLARADITLFKLPPTMPDLVAYIELALRGSFPEPLIMKYSAGARQDWLDSYLEQLLTHDVQGLVRDPDRLRRYFEALALNSGGVPKHESLYKAADINYRTAVSYDSLLSDLFVLDIVPSFKNNRLARMTTLPKRYIVDAALVGTAIRRDVRAVLSEGDLLGRVLDTFVMAQIRPELELSELRPRLYHLREEHGRVEVDIVGELSTGIVGIEVKANAAPSTDDAQHLITLRDRLGAKFLVGAVLHTGPGLFGISDRIFAIPICALWS